MYANKIYVKTHSKRFDEDTSNLVRFVPSETMLRVKKTSVTWRVSFKLNRVCFLKVAKESSPEIGLYMVKKLGDWAD